MALVFYDVDFLLLFSQNLKYNKDSRPLRSVIEKAGDILTLEVTNKYAFSKLIFRIINILIMGKICCHFYFVIMKELV